MDSPGSDLDSAEAADSADLLDSDFNAHLDSLGFILKRALSLLLLVVFSYLTEG